MKKTLLAVIAILSTLPLASQAQWTGTTDIHNTNTGNVGIAAVTPAYPLQVGTNIWNNLGSNYSLAVGGDFVIGNSNTGSQPYMRIYEGTVGAYTQIKKFNGYTTISDQQGVINFDGKVGVGTTNPAEKLHVIGNIRAEGIYPYFNLYNSAWGAHTYIQSGVDQIGNGAGNYLSFLNPAGKGFAFSQGSTAVMTIGISGNVGIGTTSPSGKLAITNTLSGAHSTNTSLLNITDAYNNGANGQFFQVIGAGDGTSYTNMNLISNYGYLSLGARADGNTTPTNFLNILSSGKVGIGTTIPDQLLTVKGTIHSQEVKVDLSVPGPDYVFHPTYKLPSLTEVKAFIDQNHHLSEIPSAAEMAKNGLDLGDMNMKLLKKVEELTLYLIEKDKEVATQKETSQSQQKEIDLLKSQLSSIMKKFQPKL